MEIIQKGTPHEITCNECQSILKWSVADLNFTQTEPGYYYMICPVCGSPIWVKRTKELDDQFSNMNESYPSLYHF